VKLLLIENNPRTARARLADLTALGFSVDWLPSLEQPDTGVLENEGYEAALLAFGGSWNEAHWQALEWLLLRVRAPVVIPRPRDALCCPFPI
jgi:hypothetical protein